MIWLQIECDIKLKWTILDDDDDDNDDIQILVRSENAITSSVHNNNTADNLILIENGEAMHNGSNNKKSRIYT